MPTLEDIAAALRSDLCLSKTLDDGTGVVLDLGSSRVLALNATGMFLVDEILQGTSTLGDLVEAITTSFEVDPETAENDVRDLLDQLARHLVPEAD
ncbi:MAG: PqqD family protein [Thermoanaerobaculia bacterium]